MSTENTAVAESNPYQPPQAVVADAPDTNAGEYFYVVAPWKFWLMSIATLSFYRIYWFYRHWALLNRHHHAYWPIPRAIFSVFFTHALFDEIDGRLQRTGSKYRWAPRRWATIYVVFALASGVISRLPQIRAAFDPVVCQLLVFALLPMMMWSTYEAQCAANRAEGDERGARNANLTAANVLWIVLGALWWSVLLLGIYLLLRERNG